MDTVPVMEKENPLKQIAQENFNTWNEALKNKDLEKILSIYAEDVILLPTLPNTTEQIICRGKEQIRGYFELFFLKDPVGFLIQQECQPLSSPNDYVFSGIYVFTCGQTKIKAKYTFVYTKSESGWHIKTHNSALL